MNKKPTVDFTLVRVRTETHAKIKQIAERERRQMTEVIDLMADDRLRKGGKDE